VVETELGRLALIPCGEINVPEVARVMMMQGAEVILHPTNSKRTDAQEAAKLTRVAENMTLSGQRQRGRPDRLFAGQFHPRRRSHIIDHHGNTHGLPGRRG
jgi:predicted amidohydrolase